MSSAYGEFIIYTPSLIINISFEPADNEFGGESNDEKQPTSKAAPEKRSTSTAAAGKSCCACCYSDIIHRMAHQAVTTQKELLNAIHVEKARDKYARRYGHKNYDEMAKAEADPAKKAEPSAKSDNISMRPAGPTRESLGSPPPIPTRATRKKSVDTCGNHPLPDDELVIYNEIDLTDDGDDEYDPLKEEQKTELPDGRKVSMSEYHRLTAAAVDSITRVSSSEIPSISTSPIYVPTALKEAIDELNSGQGMAPITRDRKTTAESGTKLSSGPASVKPGAQASASPNTGTTPTDAPTKPPRSRARAKAKHASASVGAAIAETTRGRSPTPAPHKEAEPIDLTSRKKPTSAAPKHGRTKKSKPPAAETEPKSHLSHARSLDEIGERLLALAAETPVAEVATSANSSMNSDCTVERNERTAPDLPSPDTPVGDDEFTSFIGKGQQALRELVEQGESDPSAADDHRRRRERYLALADQIREAAGSTQPAPATAKPVGADVNKTPAPDGDGDGEWTTVHRRKHNRQVHNKSPNTSKGTTGEASPADATRPAAVVIPAPRAADEFPSIKETTTVTRTTKTATPSPHHEVTEVIDVEEGQWRRHVRAPNKEHDAAAPDQRKRRSERAPSSTGASKHSRSSDEDDDDAERAGSRQEQRDRCSSRDSAQRPSSTVQSRRRIMFPRDSDDVVARTISGLANEFPSLSPSEAPTRNSYKATLVGAPITGATLVSSVRVQYLPQRGAEGRPEQMIDRRLALDPPIALSSLLANMRPRSGTLLTAALDGAQLATMQTERSALYNLRHRGLHDSGSMYADVAVRAKDNDHEGLWLGLDTANLDPSRVRLVQYSTSTKVPVPYPAITGYELTFRVTYDSDVHILDLYNTPKAERQIHKLAQVRRDFLRRQQSRLSPQRALQLLLLGHAPDDLEQECRRVRTNERRRLGELGPATLTDLSAISYSKQLLQEVRRRNGHSSSWDV
jgi:hypothetical protein